MILYCAFRLSPDQSSVPDTTALYIVKGVTLGRTNLQFTTGDNTHKMVSSPPREIQVRVEWISEGNALLLVLTNRELKFE